MFLCVRCAALNGKRHNYVISKTVRLDWSGLSVCCLCAAPHFCRRGHCCCPHRDSAGIVAIVSPGRKLNYESAARRGYFRMTSGMQNFLDIPVGLDYLLQISI